MIGERRNWKLQHVFGVLLAVMIVIQAVVIFKEPEGDWAQETAEYISAEIPREAVIESWAWEVDALSDHWQYHHPSQEFLLLSTRQLFLGSGEFDLDYDILQAEPDFLLTGDFSNWTGIYDEELIYSEFRSEAKFGPYEIFERIRY